MGGGWVGYVFVFFGCAVVFVIVGGATLFLYGVAKVRGDRDRPRASVASRARSGEASDADGGDAA